MNESKNLWGGRFTGKADAKFVEFNRSFGFDYRLFAADVRGCAAHCEGLRRAEVDGRRSRPNSKRIKDYFGKKFAKR